MRNEVIKFVLDDKLTEIDFCKANLKPTTTLLNYLRTLPNHKGVKEGCAEGDCGACSVVISSFDVNGKLKYTVVDSCLLFLPMVHGKNVITIENLVDQNNLHPVQEVLLDENGTQCGYCTPGIVMSLFGVYKNNKNISENEIKNSLVGNLCRCTGYDSIFKSALKISKLVNFDKFTKNENKIIEILKYINVKDVITITDTEQIYLKAFSKKQILNLLNEYPNATIVNGATDIALKQTKKNETLKLILDISDVKELKIIKKNKNNIELGAGCTLEEIRKFTKKELPYFADILNLFASLQIRNVATIGGNICTASPIGDLLPLLFVTNAEVLIEDNKSSKHVEVSSFITNYRKTILKNNQIVTKVLIPLYNNEHIIKSFKISKRTDLDISILNGAINLKLNKNRVESISIAFGGVSAVTKFAKKTENYLIGKEWNVSTIEKAQEILYNEFEPLSDVRSGIEYRKLLAKNLLLKFYLYTLRK